MSNTLKLLWLRDYDLPAMQEKIKQELAEGKTPDDCVVKADDVHKALKEARKQVFDEIEKLDRHKEQYICITSKKYTGLKNTILEEKNV